MILKGVLSLINKETPVALEVHNKFGYETTYDLKSNDCNLLNPRLLNATVTGIEIYGKKLLISILIEE